MSLPIILSVTDGTMVVDVPACATNSHTITSGDTQTGYGTIEYLTGKARRWELFRRRSWTIQATGRAASGLAALDRSVDYWTATFRDPTNPGTPADPDGTPLVVTVVPFTTSESYSQPSAEHTLSVNLLETLG